jgi:GT2 family glycosyltransferase
MTPRVRVVVLNYNGGEHVLECVAALERTEWPRDSLELVVVDNASVDGSIDEIERRFEQVRVIRNATNTGFPANNGAMRDLEAVDYVALINNDAFVQPGWLSPLVDALETDPGLGAACPRILFAPRFVEVTIEAPTFQVRGDGRDLGVRVSGLEVDGKDVLDVVQLHEGAWGFEQGGAGEPHYTWTAGRAVLRLPIPAEHEGPVDVRIRVAAETAKALTVRSDDAAVSGTADPSPHWVRLTAAGPGFDVINNVGSELVTLGFGADRGFEERDRGQYDEPTEVFAWCGGGVVLRRSYLEQVGLFDERFFLYYEDTDLAWRGRAQGWRYRYIPTSVVRHLHAASSGAGSPMFQHYVERNRLLMLVKNAPAALVANALYRYVRMMASFLVRAGMSAGRHRSRPDLGLVRRRARSLGAAVRLMPAMLADRRVLRRRQVVPDHELVAWMVDR